MTISTKEIIEEQCKRTSLYEIVEGHPGVNQDLRNFEACGRCAALIPEQQMKKHINWHIELETK